MKKTIIIAIAIVVFGLGLWLILGNSSDSEMSDGDESTNENTQQTTETSTNDEGSGLGSLADIFGLGNSVQCEYKSAVEGEVSEGTFYTDGERFRVESTYTTPEGTVTSNMINDGEYIYTWGESPQGPMAFKMVVPDTEMTENEPPTQQAPDNNSYVDIDQEVEYDCKNWSVDSSMFEPPSDVEFTDMEAMMREMQQGLPEGFEMPEGM